ncbi:Beta-galactosidase 13-like protein [Drosera capensis]
MARTIISTLDKLRNGTLRVFLLAKSSSGTSLEGILRTYISRPQLAVSVVMLMKDTDELQCQGEGTIKEIKFASFGNPGGTCGSFFTGDCAAPKTEHIVKRLCLGKSHCVIHLTDKLFRTLPCLTGEARLAVEAVC